MNENEFRNLFSKRMRDSSESISFLDSILPGGKLTILSAFGVYEEGYIARLSQALGDKFETVWRILGDEDFFETCHSYIRTFPSESYNLSDYGENFPKFIGEVFSDHPFIRETAEFESEVSKVFHLSENRISELPDSLSTKNPNDLIFEFHESLKFLRYSYAVYDLWKNKKSEKQIEIPSAEPQYILLGKKENDLHVKIIEEWDWKFGKSLLEGKTLVEAVGFSGELPEGQESISKFLSLLAQAGFIKSVKIS